MTDLKDLSRRFYKDVFENHDVDAADRYIGENVVEHFAPPPGMELKPGREGVKDLLRVYLGSFHPMTVEVHHIYEDAGTVIAHVTFHATHSGAFAGVPPTGKQVSVEEIDITRFDGDRMVEHWGQMDTIGLLTQIGAVPSPA
jgi:predicted SnoaL-like aldol condensation-catalyzing enzyme